MTIASTTHTDCRQPEGIDRLAQRIGLALVAWSERSVVRREATREDQYLRLQTERAARQLLAGRDESRAVRPIRLF